MCLPIFAARSLNFGNEKKRYCVLEKDGNLESCGLYSENKFARQDVWSESAGITC